MGAEVTTREISYEDQEAADGRTGTVTYTVPADLEVDNEARVADAALRSRWMFDDGSTWDSLADSPGGRLTQHLLAHLLPKVPMIGSVPVSVTWTTAPWDDGWHLDPYNGVVLLESGATLSIEKLGDQPEFAAALGAVEVGHGVVLTAASAMTLDLRFGGVEFGKVIYG